MSYHYDSDHDDAPSAACSNASFGSQGSYLPDCKCEECLKTSQAHSRSALVPFRDGDFAKMKENVLVFMMEVRKRQRFPLLALPDEVRFLILSELLYCHEPLRFGSCDGPRNRNNFSFHAQILATCHQLQDEGSEILMCRNMFTLNLYGHALERSYKEWMGSASDLRTISQLAHWDRFESIRKLTVLIVFQDHGSGFPIQLAARLHRTLVCSLVTNILWRKNRLSSLDIVCLLQLAEDDAYVSVDDSEASTEDDSEASTEDDSEASTEDDSEVSTENDRTLTVDQHVLEPLTVEQYILEPLMHLRGAADICNLYGNACRLGGVRREAYEIHRPNSLRSTTEV